MGKKEKKEEKKKLILIRHLFVFFAPFFFYKCFFFLFLEKKIHSFFRVLLCLCKKKKKSTRRINGLLFSLRNIISQNGKNCDLFPCRERLLLLFYFAFFFEKRFNAFFSSFLWNGLPFFYLIIGNVGPFKKISPSIKTARAKHFFETTT